MDSPPFYSSSVVPAPAGKGTIKPVMETLLGGILGLLNKAWAILLVITVLVVPSIIIMIWSGIWKWLN